MKALKIAGGLLGAVIVVLALALAFGLPASFLTVAIQDRVERDTGYRLSIAGGATVSLWPSLQVTLTDITLQDPKDRDGNNRLTVSRLQADMALSSLWSGRPDISEISIEKPTLYLPLLRERLRDNAPRSRSSAKPESVPAVRIASVTVTDGAVILSNPRDRVENRLEGLSATGSLSGDKIKIKGSARAGDRPVTFEINAAAPAMPIDRQTLPVDFRIGMESAFRGVLAGRADVRLNGALIMINGLSGTLGDGDFNGWASVDLASKPLVKIDLDVRRLDLPDSAAPASSRAAGWSTAAIDLRGLNYLDARVKLSATDIGVSGARLGPLDMEASLAGGLLKATVINLGVYDGQAAGEAVIDASTGNPAYAMHGDIVGVRALPLLQNLAGFDKLDARMQGKLALRSSGASQQAIMNNLSGSTFLLFQDGVIRGINVAQMIRSLTTNPLSGWQDSKELTTDLTQLSASFQIERGQAATTDLNLVGPLVKVTGAGTVDLGNRALAMRVEPKLVMTTEGQGRTSNPVGLGIPVVIDGPWSQPRFYPDMAGILDDPEGTYAKLKQMGQGLFGKDGAGLNNLLNGIGGLIGNAAPSTGPVPNAPTAAPNAQAPAAGQSDLLGGQLGATIGNLIQQGLQQAAPPQPRSRGRTVVPPAGIAAAPQADQPPPAAPADAGQGGATGEAPAGADSVPDSQPMNDVLKRIFNR
ncbi:putative AsmA-like protein [Bradyrhizobium sp. ORS 278]|uniref:AsmA family protein n=1 Tax=Bradyrhizobium sp. (strain ORS 278) TaxID=114615 RepID=UPI0001507FE0|nr:AsmA family protein [Bradyrhizobium sp. ORS 278]CAL80558.1 putative AsmA-like protein [Bradyrhizobium sp. ORS 278]